MSSSSIIPENHPLDHCFYPRSTASNANKSHPQASMGSKNSEKSEEFCPICYQEYDLKEHKAF